MATITHSTVERVGEAPESKREHGEDDHSRPAPSRVAIFGHPVHAMLIPFPLSLLTAAFIADVAAWRTSDPFWIRVALWLVGSGVVTGLTAALFGLLDFLTIRRARAHLVGWVHALGAGLTLLLAAGSWWLRARAEGGFVISAVVLSGAAAAVLVVTGWAGGELPYRHLVGVVGHGAHGEHASSRAGGASRHQHD